MKFDIGENEQHQRSAKGMKVKKNSKKNKCIVPTTVQKYSTNLLV